MNLVERFKKEKIAINCETRWESDEFIDWCHKNRIEFLGYWCDEEQSKKVFENFLNETCYCYNLNNDCYLGYCDCEFYKRYGYTVIKYKDFFKGETNMIKVKDIAEKYGEYEIDENKLKEFLVEPQPKTVWDLQVCDTYYCISSNGYISESRWEDDHIDGYRRATGNCFLTYEEAEFEVERRKVETLLLKYGGTRDMMSIGCLHNEKYYIYYDNQSNSIDVNYNYCNQEHNIYFKNRKDCWDAIEKIGIDRIKKYLFHVEEDK